MTRCHFCGRRLWPFQRRVPMLGGCSWHRSCYLAFARQQAEEADIWERAARNGGI